MYKLPGHFGGMGMNGRGSVRRRRLREMRKQGEITVAMAWVGLAVIANHGAIAWLESGNLILHCQRAAVSDSVVCHSGIRCQVQWQWVV